MTDTPRTDKLLSDQEFDRVPYDDAAMQLAELCRELERERDAALAEVAEYEAVRHRQAVELLRVKNESVARQENHSINVQLTVALKERDEAREAAENLVEYAHECLVQLESWGSGYAKYEQKMETIREAIAGCEKWKEAAK